MKTRLALFGTLLLLAGAGSLLAQTQPQAITWAATDTQGKGVAIPGERPTLLVFLRPGQAQSEEMIKLLLPLLKDRKDLQILAVVSGDEAATGVKQIEKSKWTFPAVADASYDTSGTFGVRVWPTAVIVSAKGQQVAHLPGLPVSFGNDVAAYLDFAAGKIDKAALDKALANRAVVADSEDQKAARHAEVALRLAQKGMKDLAVAEVAKALELKPTRPELLLSLARTDLIAGDFKAADVLLARIPPAAQSPGEFNTLKGWAALLGERWADARQSLTDASRLNPDPAEAFYLLGRVYEHDGDAARAAECYRKAFEHASEGKEMLGS